MSRVVVIGAGAIGGTLAALLSETGHQVTVAVRAPIGELVVRDPRGERRARVQVATRPEEVSSADWVLLATKAHQTAGARAWIERLAVPGARLAVLQNGVEHRERVAAFVRGAAVVPVVVALSASRPEPGVIAWRGEGELTVASDDDGASFAALWAGTPVRASVTDDFTTVAWAKLCFNVPAALMALTGQSAAVLRRPGSAAMARGLVAEAVAVGRAAGARFDEGLVEQVVERIQGSPASVPSLAQDARARRPLEHDARNGAVVRIGARLGVATPLNAMVDELLAALSESFER